MKRNLKAIVIILCIIVFAVFLHFTPIDNIFTKIPFINELYYSTMLTVNTPKGRADVFVNGKNYGQTPVSITSFKEGKYVIELEKISNTENFYPIEKFNVNLYRKSEAIIDVEIAPDGFKSGYVVSYAPAPSNIQNIGYLTLDSSIDNYTLFIDESMVDKKNVVSYELNEGEYNLRIEAESYESIEFPIIIRQGYNLNTTIYLLPIPINLNQDEKG